jgi:hypothetical protein
MTWRSVFDFLGAIIPPRTKQATTKQNKAIKRPNTVPPCRGARRIPLLYHIVAGIIMNRERPAAVLLSLWSGITSILVVVDGFSASRILPISTPTRATLRHTNGNMMMNSRHYRRATLLPLQMSATQSYLDSLSGYATDGVPVPALSSFAEESLSAAFFSSDYYDSTSLILAENNGVELNYVAEAATASSGDVMSAAATTTTFDAVTTTSPFDSVNVESVDAVKEDLWGLGSTVFDTNGAVSDYSSAAATAPSSSSDTFANYWDNVVVPSVAPWYETAKAKQEELVASLLSDQQRELAVSSLLPKTNPLDGLGESWQNMGNPFQSISLPNVPPVQMPSMSKLADASLVDIFSAMGRTLGTIARGFWYVLTSLVEFITGGRTHLDDVTDKIRYSIDSSMNDALDAVRSSLYDLGQVTLEDAVVFLVQVVFRFVELLFTLVSSVCQALTGRGLDVWLQTIGSGLSEQATLVANTLSSTVHDLSHASLAELSVILTSYAIAVARVLMDSPRLLADAFTASGAADLVQTTMTAVESTTSLLGSTGGGGGVF